MSRLAVVLVALRSLHHPRSDTDLPTCSKASWLAALLKAVRVSRRLLRSSKVSLACLATCKLPARRASMLPQLPLTTHSRTVASLKDLASMDTVPSRRSQLLLQVQVSRVLVLVAVLMASRRLSKASRIRTQAHLV